MKISQSQFHFCHNQTYPISTQNKCIFLLKCRNNLLFILGFLIVGDVEVTELEGLLVGGNDAQPIADLVLLQELLGEVLQVALGEGNVGDNSDLVVGTARDHDGFTQVVGATLNLDAIVKELLLQDTVSKRSHGNRVRGYLRRQQHRRSCRWLGQSSQ